MMCHSGDSLVAKLNLTLSVGVPLCGWKTAGQSG